MKYLKLRIVWSVASGTLAVLICVLWVRSYSNSDAFYMRIGNCCYVVESFSKLVAFKSQQDPANLPPGTTLSKHGIRSRLIDDSFSTRSKRVRQHSELGQTQLNLRTNRLPLLIGILPFCLLQSP